MRVLLVAPRTNLLLAEEEVQDILRSGLDVTPMIGNVTSTELLREIKTGVYDMLWLATHGEVRVNAYSVAEYGIVLSDGFMAAGELVAQVRGKFSLVFLNSCTSFHIAQQIQEEANVTVIGTILEVPDRQAYQTGSIFASWLASGLPPAQAYRRSKPGGQRVYMYLTSLEPSFEAIDSLVLELQDFRREIERNNELMEKDRRFRWRLIMLGIFLHPITWALVYILYRLTLEQ